MHRIAMISVHSCPLGRLGSKDTGGMNVYVRELAAELARAGLRVDVYTRKLDPRDPLVAEMAPGVRLVRLEAGDPGPTDKNDLLAHLPQFIAGLDEYRRRQGLVYDLVHSHYWLSALAGMRLAKAWAVPHVVMFHTLGEVKNRCGAPGQESALRIDGERLAIHAADRIVAASEDERAHLARLYAADPRRVTVIPCGVNLGLFQPADKAEARSLLGLNGKRVLLFVGRMDPLKGLDLLLHATAMLLPEMPDLHLVAVGGDAAPESEESRVRRLAADLGLQDRVDFVGAIPQTALPAYYNAADICAVPSFYESFGLVAVEALASGTPVVASRVGGLPNVVKHGENGLLVERRTAEDFAASLGGLLRDEAKRGHLAARARASVQPLAWRAIARRVLHTYQGALVEREAAPESAQRYRRMLASREFCIGCR
ncbi:MAG: glycosyltransferase [Chloroflexota bacterium]